MVRISPSKVAVGHVALRIHSRTSNAVDKITPYTFYILKRKRTDRVCGSLRSDSDRHVYPPWGEAHSDITLPRMIVYIHDPVTSTGLAASLNT